MNIYEVIGEILSQPRSTWCDSILPYIVSIKKNSLELASEKDFSDFFPDMKHFSEHYKGKFNIGDYVTHAIYGGYYRVCTLEALDIRNNKLDNIKKPYKGEFIQQFGNSYHVLGIDSKGQCSGTEIYLLGNYPGKDFLLDETVEDQLIFVSKDKIPQDIKNKVNKFLYSFKFEPDEILEQLKATE